MKQCRITIVRKASYLDLSLQYENPIQHTCDYKEGMVFLSKDAQMPDGFCQSAWQNLQPFVFALAGGAKNLFDGWMKNPFSAMISCNDGFRPVSFLIEAIEEHEEGESP